MMTRLLPFGSLRKAGFSRANTLPIEDWPWQGYKWEVCPTSSFSVYMCIYICFLVISESIRIDKVVIQKDQPQQYRASIRRIAG